MCYQECALYGELVLWLRDQAARLLAGDKGDVGTEQGRLDSLIRDWFFTAQDELHGCAPRDLIWAEQLGQPNPIHPERIGEFFEDDCPVCQLEQDNLKTALASGDDPGFRWHYDDGGYPLIARYDPEGWDERWAEQDAEFEAWQAEEEAKEGLLAPAYEPARADPRQVDPNAFLEILRQPWIDPALHQAADKMAERCDVPMPDAVGGLRYRRVTQSEALSLLAGLDRQGVHIEALLAHLAAWPYQNVALDWLSEPERNVALLCRAIEAEPAPRAEETLIRLRQHRDFVLTLTELVPPAARLWLQGWLEATAHGAFAAGLPF
jgi:hypothetical protein